MNKLREDMIKEFTASLEQERIPWRKEWTEQGGRPCNAVTGNNYRGINVLWLMYVQEKMGYDDNRWCTFKQAQEQGWRIRKGEKGTRVEFWSWYDTETKKRLDRKEMLSLRNELDRDEFQKRVKPMDRVSIVFNGRQIEGIPEYTPAHNVLDEETLIAQRAVLLNNMALSFYEGEAGAYYQPATDSVHMPDIDRFENEYAYMATFLHEAGHATGHVSRLNRNVKGSFGTPDYAREELRAEIASAFTAQILGLPGADSNFDNHKAYIQDWISILEKEPNELFQAIKEAEKISDYLIEKGEFNLVRKKEHNAMAERMIKMDESSREQRDEIRLGQENGLDVGVYADPDYSFLQMVEIQRGLEEGLDVSIYADARYKWNQMASIRKGLERGRDVSVYADLKFAYDQMNEILEGIEKGVDVKTYADPEFDSEQMEQIRKGLEAGLDVSIYAEPRFESIQMAIIRDGLRRGLNASIYADPKFNWKQMNQIRRGLEKGLDVSVYADPAFDNRQMQQIWQGLEEGLDVSLYTDPRFGPRQMEEIRHGLESGLDVGVYADPKLEASQMEQIRKGMEKELKHSRERSVKEMDLFQRYSFNQMIAGQGVQPESDEVKEALYMTSEDEYQAEMPERKVIEMDKFNETQQNQIQLGLEKGLDVSVYADPKFNADQMEQIRKGLKDGLDVSTYADPKFNGDQMSAIRNGLELEVDVSKYADPKYDFEQMMQIHFGLEFGVDVSVYADPQYNEDQMREIRSGLQKELDVSAYADPKFSHEQMSEIRWGLQEGLDARIYADPRFDLEQIKEIQKGLEQGLDVSKYADPKFSHEQMMQIHFGLEDGADVSVYADPNYNPDQMSAIRWGLHDELDVSKYADPKFTVKQMEQIRYGLMSRVDAGRYANPNYGFLQMAEIRKGLESGVDVSLYAAQDLNALQMNEIRQALEKGENVMKWDQKASILGYYAGEDGSQYILYQTGDPEKEYLTNGEKKWSDPEEIKRILSELKQIPHLKDRQLMMGYLQKHYPYDAITGYMQKIVGEVSYSTNRAVGEVIQYTSAEEYLKTVREDIKYQSSSGFGYRTFTNDPETRKGIDDIVYDQFGERNPHDLDYYRDPYNPADKRKMTVEEIYLSLPPEKQKMYDLALDQKHSDLEEMTRLIEEQRQELQQNQKQIQERSRTHGKA